jgi:hypothetical protein
MANLFDRLKAGRASSTEKAPDPVPQPAAADADVRGKDPRRLAEEKAERAGAKWRQAAESRGEIPKEIGGPKGLEPTRYGDWEKAGRCFDF